VIIANSGCLLLLLIFLNLFFGRLFFSTQQWLAIGGILVLLFLLNSYISFRRIVRTTRKKQDRVIDVEGKVLK